MELEGWTIKPNNNDSLLFEKEYKKINLVIYPVLLEQRFIQQSISNIDCCISDYELEKSLPSVYMKIASI